MPKPDLAAVPQWYHKYVQLIDEQEVRDALRNNSQTAFDFLQAVPDEKWLYRYAEGKWSVNEMVQHLIDAERIFCYRALCIARKEQASLPGFDENSYAAASKADGRSTEDLLAEFETVRQGTEALFESFDEEQLSETGIANNNSINVNAIGFIIAGHVQHHLNILKERYL